MKHALVFVANPDDKPAYREALLMLGRVALSRKLPPPEVLSGWESAQWIYESVDGELRQEAAAAVAELPVDWALVPVEGRKKSLLVADMDSTIINVECLDELADYAGIKAEIAAITERAMRGELDFEPALLERVGKLKGLPLEDLQRCFDERVRLNPGAETLVKTMRAHGARCVLVSGGFSFFTSRVAALAGFGGTLAFSVLQPANAQLMALPGKLDVNDTGALTYSIPIDVPPGTASLSRNGVFAVGIGLLVLDERLTTREGVGVLVVALGLALLRL